MFKVLITCFLFSPLCLFARTLVKSGAGCGNKDVIADTTTVKNIAEKFKNYTQTNYSEKIYLHFDKPYYAAGDTIYFKAYVTTASAHLLTDSSGILHVDLINNGKIQTSIRLPLIGGIAWGDLALPDTLKQSNYHIRAYTNLIRNQGSDEFFDKMLPIGNGIANGVFAKATYTPDANNKQLINAVINYANIEGTPYVEREVSYQIQSGATLIKGNGVTNINGNLSFSFISAGAARNATVITTHLKLDVTLTVTKTLTIKPVGDSFDVQFFPEGGCLVSGVRSKMAFKAVGSNGLSVDIKGSVVDDQGKEIAPVATRHAGMGAIFIVPEAGRTYIAKLSYPDGSTGSVNLPTAKNDGYVLGVFNNPADSNIIVKIAAGATTFQRDQNTDITLVVQSGGNIVYAAKSKLEAALFTTTISRSRFKTGIAQFTLFSASSVPLNERVIFVQNPAKFVLALNTVKQTYAPREKVALSILAKTADSTATGSYSIAVTDETKVPVDDDDGNSILSNLLLTSDIKGYIEKPNYYFNNVTDSTKADLDLVMLTQGYRRFAWKTILSGQQPPPTFKPERAIDITGQVKTFTGKPAVGAKVILTSKSQGIFVIDSLTDKQGRFAFRNVFFADSLQFFISATNAKGSKDVDITLDQPLPAPAIKKNAADDLEVNSAMQAYLLNSKKQYDNFIKFGLIKKGTILKEVAINSKRPALRHTDNLNAPGSYDFLIKSDKLLQYSSIIESLYSAIPSMQIKPDHRVYFRHSNRPMLIIIDGTQMVDTPQSPFTLDDVDVNIVASIEVLTNVAYTTVYGPNATNGVFLITTKKTPQDYDDAWGNQDKSTPGIISFTGMGYYKAREFYSPIYDNPKTNQNIADLRTTIYWNPNIITDKGGHSTVSFFNADTPGIYKAVIEGIDTDGNIGRQVFRYKVE